MNSTGLNILGKKCAIAAKLYFARACSNRVANKLTYDAVDKSKLRSSGANNLVYRSPDANKLVYQQLDRNALRKLRKEEYLSQIDVEEYNLQLKKNKESVRDHFFTSSFNTYMRGRKFFKSPMNRVSTLFTDDFYQVFGILDLYPTFQLDRNGNLIKDRDQPFEMSTDVVVVGGGMVGASIAYHIKRLLESDIKVTIIDKDFSYRKAATSYSLGGVKQQFTVKENIELSKYAAAFLDNAKEELSFEGRSPDIGFNYSGFLTLGNESHITEMEKNFAILRDNDVEAKLLYKKELQSKFPWMEAEGIEAGILGMEQEGWFDHVSLLDSLHLKCSHLGTEYVVGDVVDCDIEKLESYVWSHNHTGKATRVVAVKVKLSSGHIHSVPCGLLVVAGGTNSPNLGKVFDLGTDPNQKSIYGKELPIFRRRNFCYKIHVKKGPGLNCPIVQDPSGIVFRRDGLSNTYICQATPPPDVAQNEASRTEYFKEHLAPALEKISKSFKDCKILASYSADSDFNSFDLNPLIGFHRGVTNMFVATGFNNSSVHALGVGNYFMEKILAQDLTIDLDKYTPNRYLCIKNRQRDYKIVEGCVQ